MAHEQGRKIAEAPYLFPVIFERSLEPVECASRDLQCPGMAASICSLCSSVRGAFTPPAHSMTDVFSCPEQLYDLADRCVSKLCRHGRDPDTFSGRPTILRSQDRHPCRGENRRREIKETQRMGLYHLGQAHYPPEQIPVLGTLTPRIAVRRPWKKPANGLRQMPQILAMRAGIS